jgi:hypothetical protein
MKPKRFYLNLQHGGSVKQGFAVRLSSKQTIVSSSVPLLRNIHTTMHHPQHEKGMLETVSHVRETKQNQTETLIRVPRDKRLLELIGIYIDRDQFQSSKEFKKSAYDGEYTVPADFGDHLTVRFFQGPPDIVSKAMDHLIATRRPGVVIPHPDGFYIDPAAREGTNKVNYAQIIFDQ